MKDSILMVQELTKRYGPAVAVDGLSFDVRPGEVFGLLGPNGAGKTTTLECIEGLRLPSAGTIEVAGLHPGRDSRLLRKVLGVQLQTSALPDTMLAGEAMALVSAWHGCKPRQDLLERFGMAGLINKQYGKMSTGQKRRLQLALALAGDPKVVVLDEPTAGVDVQGRAELHAAIRELKQAGVTLLLATHDMAEAETLCDRIAILIGGRLAALGTPEQVTAAGSAQTRITLRTRHGSLLGQGGIRLATYVREAEGFTQWLCRETAPAVMELLGAAMEAGDPVDDLRVERPSLEERFLTLLVFYVVPLVFYIVMGAVFSSVTPDAKQTLAATMAIFAVTMGAVLGVPPTLVKMREANVLRAYRVNGIPGPCVLLSLGISALIHVGVVSVLIALSAPVLCGATVPLHAGGFAVALASVLLCSVALGLLIGVVAKSQAMAMMLSQAVFLPSLMLGGIMFPASLLPKPLMAIGQAFPATHAMRAFSGLAFGTDAGFGAWAALLIVLGLGLAAALVTAWRFGKITRVS